MDNSIRVAIERVIKLIFDDYSLPQNIVNQCPVLKNKLLQGSVMGNRDENIKQLLEKLGPLLQRHLGVFKHFKENVSFVTPPGYFNVKKVKQSDRFNYGAMFKMVERGEADATFYLGSWNDTSQGDQGPLVMEDDVFALTTYKPPQSLNLGFFESGDLFSKHFLILFAIIIATTILSQKLTHRRDFFSIIAVFFLQDFSYLRNGYHNDRKDCKDTRDASDTLKSNQEPKRISFQSPNSSNRKLLYLSILILQISLLFNAIFFNSTFSTNSALKIHYQQVETLKEIVEHNLKPFFIKEFDVHSLRPLQNDIYFRKLLQVAYSDPATCFPGPEDISRFYEDLSFQSGKVIFLRAVWYTVFKQVLCNGRNKEAYVAYRSQTLYHNHLFILYRSNATERLKLYVQNV